MTADALYAVPGMSLPTKTAADINAAHRLAQQTGRAAVAQAAECGRMLLAVKADLPHGHFLSWVAAHCEFSYATAKIYARAARHVEKGNALPFSLRSLIASEKLATPKPAWPPCAGMTAIRVPAHDADGPTVFVQESSRHPGCFDLAAVWMDSGACESLKRPVRADGVALFVAQWVVGVGTWHQAKDSGLAFVFGGRQP